MGVRTRPALAVPLVHELTRESDAPPSRFLRECGLSPLLAQAGSDTRVHSFSPAVSFTRLDFVGFVVVVGPFFFFKCFFPVITAMTCSILCY